MLAAEADVTDAVFNVAQRDARRACSSSREMLLRVMGSDLDVEYGPERAVNKVSRRLADTTRRAQRARLRGRGRTSRRA